MPLNAFVNHRDGFGGGVGGDIFEGGFNQRLAITINGSFVLSDPK